MRDAKENMHNLFRLTTSKYSEIPGELMISLYAWGNSIENAKSRIKKKNNKR